MTLHYIDSCEFSPRNHMIYHFFQYCPDECTPCPPGTYCFEGKMYDCKPGTYSDGSGMFYSLALLII